ncbi:MAG: hypothetical protein PVG19_09055 [Desulfobacterales bacterium]|jgi:hypothetical protein
MKPNANVWKPFCLALVLALVLCPGAWGEAPAEKAPTDEIDDGPIKQDPNPMNVATDALLLRPLGLIMIPVTAIVYVIGYPFAKASGSEDEAYQALVGNTIEYTFERPLGGGAPFE